MLLCVEINSSLDLFARKFSAHYLMLNQQQKMKKCRINGKRHEMNAVLDMRFIFIVIFAQLIFFSSFPLFDVVWALIFMVASVAQVEKFSLIKQHIEIVDKNNECKDQLVFFAQILVLGILSIGAFFFKWCLSSQSVNWLIFFAYIVYDLFGKRKTNFSLGRLFSMSLYAFSEMRKVKKKIQYLCTSITSSVVKAAFRKPPIYYAFHLSFSHLFISWQPNEHFALFATKNKPQFSSLNRSEKMMQNNHVNGK